MITDFNSRLNILNEEHKKLITRKNERIEPGNGIYYRYKYPVLTGDHAPLFWRYDLNPCDESPPDGTIWHSCSFQCRSNEI